MYARTLEHQGTQQVLEFGVSGKLIMNVLVMYDRQTDSYWSQLLGEAVEGPLKGAKLTPVPALQTTWAEWKQLHPDTLALQTGGAGPYDSYSSYYSSSSLGVLGETLADERVPSKELVVGIVVDDTPAAYPHSLLTEEIVVNDEVAGRPLMVAFQPQTRAASVFDRRIGDQTLTFAAGKAALELVDQETGSTWFLLSGMATDGPLAGEELVRIPSTSSFWFGWKDWHPETKLYAGVGNE